MQAEGKTIADDGLPTAMHASWVAAHSQLEYCGTFKRELTLFSFNPRMQQHS